MRRSRLARRSALVGYAELRRHTPLARRGFLGSGRAGRRRGPDALARAAVKERDRGRCRVCGRTGFTHPHHRVPLGRGGGNGVANLISLCPSCHRDVHGWPGWAGVAGLLLPAGADAAAVPVVLPGRGVVWLTCDGQAVPADGAGGAAGITEVC